MLLAWEYHPSPGDGIWNYQFKVKTRVMDGRGVGDGEQSRWVDVVMSMYEA
jgi:hypothetical protein